MPTASGRTIPSHPPHNIRTRPDNPHHRGPNLAVLSEQSDDQLSQLLLIVLIHSNHLHAVDIPPAEGTSRIVDVPESIPLRLDPRDHSGSPHRPWESSLIRCSQRLSRS
jgi:hypothetical protein